MPSNKKGLTAERNVSRGLTLEKVASFSPENGFTFSNLDEGLEIANHFAHCSYRIGGAAVCRRHDHAFQVYDTAKVDAFKSELNCTLRHVAFSCIGLSKTFSPHSAQTRQCSLFRRRQQSDYICFQTQRFLQDASSIGDAIARLSKVSIFEKSTCFWPVAQEHLNFGPWVRLRPRPRLRLRGKTDRRFSLRAGRVSFANRILIGQLKS